jgi:hypothetical protein
MTAPTVQRRVDAEVCLPIVLHVREPQVGRFSPWTVPGDTRDLTPIVAARALLDAGIAVVRSLLEHAAVTSDARWKETFVLRVREASLVRP